MKTTLQIVTEAQLKTQSWDRETVLTETLLMGYNISPAGDVFRALETIHKGTHHGSNYKLNRADKQPPGRKSDRHKKRYEERKKNGLCVKCGKLAKAGSVLCQKCLINQREVKRKLSQRRKEYGNVIALGIPV